jgi:neutral ceramidase
MRVGAGEVEITPDFEVELSGFASRVQPCVGVERPIFARAVYLEDGGEKLLWVGCDVIALERDLVESVREWARNELRLEARQVMLSATHTHSAPATVHLFAAGTYSSRYAEMLEGKIRDVARAAMHRPEACEVVAVKEKLELAIDRRGKASAHVNPWVWGIGFRRSDGSFVAACVNYAMHPVAHGHVQRNVSPDWCGGTADALGEKLAGHPIVMVSNGAAGNLNPPIVDRSWEEVRALGETVADAIAVPLASAKAQADGLMVRSEKVMLPLAWMDEDAVRRNAEEAIAKIPADWQWTELFRGVIESWREKTIAEVRAGRGREVEMEIQVARIGEVYLVAVNGEIFSKFTEMLREKTGKALFVVGYANAAFGYVPTREAYAEGGYEVEQAHLFYGSFRPLVGGLEMLCEEAARIVRGM